jgi:hypothetical protein
MTVALVPGREESSWTVPMVPAPRPGAIQFILLGLNLCYGGGLLRVASFGDSRETPANLVRFERHDPYIVDTGGSVDQSEDYRGLHSLGRLSREDRESDGDVVRRLFNFLEDRRVLSEDPNAQTLFYVGPSVKEIRDRLTQAIDSASKEELRT